MSNDRVVFIPADPDQRLNASVMKEAAAWLRTRLAGARITYALHDERVFVDAGENMESVRCPRCDADLEDPWHDAMSASYETSRFAHIAWTTPCCGHATNLHALCYQGAQGFAFTELCIEFGVELTGRPLPSQEEIEAQVGAPLRRVEQHY